MEIVIAADVPTKQQSQSGSLRAGDTVRQALLSDETRDGLNFRLIRSQYMSGDAAFESPRHRHSFQQIRFTEVGSVNYGPGDTIPEGDVAYFPRGTFYGPQHKDAGIGLLLQFGFNGEHQAGPRWAGHRPAALEQLNANGSFADGTYTTTDPATGETVTLGSNLALYRAQYELETGRPVTVPEAGYEKPILMHVDAFEYYSASPGVEIKHLGAFYDHPGPDADLSIFMVRLSTQGIYELSQDRGQIAWSRNPGLIVAGSTYPAVSCIYSPRGETTALASADQTEVYVAQMPVLISGGR